MRILILDDDAKRHEGYKAIFKQTGHETVHVWTYFACLDKLEQACLEGRPFGMACLDHDLGDNTDIPADIKYGMYSSRPFDGRDVCWFLRGNQHLCPPKVLIHSWNPTGAVEMRDILQAIPGILDLRVRAFGT